MPAFEEILKHKSSDVSRPQALPVGSYHAIVDGVPEQQENRNGNKFFAFKYKIMRAMEDVDQTLAVEQQVVGKIIFDNYYVTEKAEFRLWDLLKDSLGINTDNKELGECLAEVPNRQLIVTLRHRPSEDGKRVFHEVAMTAAV